MILAAGLASSVSIAMLAISLSSWIRERRAAAVEDLEAYSSTEEFIASFGVEPS